MEATVTKKRGRPPKAEKKPTLDGKKTRRAVAKAPVAKNGKAKKDEEGFKVGERALPGMEDANERIKPLDDECQRFLSERDKKKNAKEEMDTIRGTIGELLKEHDRESYVVNGEKFFIEPGVPEVKVKKVSQRG
jgi:uncharacterized small protein (DUF1192 family)